jgi:hypothetical protein
VGGTRRSASKVSCWTKVCSLLPPVLRARVKKAAVFILLKPEHLGTMTDQQAPVYLLENMGRVQDRPRAQKARDELEAKGQEFIASPAPACDHGFSIASESFPA